MKPLPRSWFEGDAVTLAPKLLGKIIKKGPCTGVIVETEAYMSDPASHAAKFKKKGALMRETHGYWYVYFTYGMHWCANITCDKTDVGAVLIRAVEPVEGISLMKRRRKTDMLKNLTSGPAKFCQAFGITGKDNGRIAGGDFAIYDAPGISKKDISVSSRIGISKSIDLPWRFYIKESPFVSPVRNQISSGVNLP